MSDHPWRCQCGQVLDGGDPWLTNVHTGDQVALAPEPGRTRMQPIPGCIVVCLYCQKISRFTEKCVLIPLSSFEFQKLPKGYRQALRQQQKALARASRRRPS